MCKNGVHDGNVDITVFSEIYEVSVSVFLYLKTKSLIHCLLCIVGWFVAERNVSLVFTGDLDNGHYDALLSVEDKWSYFWLILHAF
jgi:hypothetical protein